MQSSHELSTPVANSIYAKNVYVKNSFTYTENDESSIYKMTPVEFQYL